MNGPRDFDRRTALKFLAGGIALPLAGCGKPAEEIVPYVDMPEGLLPGEPMKFATTLALGGYGRGALVSTIDGRPIKVEGNPRHPASLGATDVFAEADILSLYDPDRSQAPRHRDDVATWDAFALALRGEMQRATARQGAGLALLTERVTSPTLRRQIGDLLKQYPQARWYVHEPVSDDFAVRGSTMAFGRPLSALPRIADAALIVAIDADFLGAGPRQIADARAFAQRRQRAVAPFLRLYAVEPDWSLTGANADHRLALHPGLLRNLALAIAAHLQGESPPDLPEGAAQLAKAAAADLEANHGRAIVMVGERQPPELHALAHWL
ncbi:MAG TPA: 4Fe-4S ferredoxin, partial [Pseudolabrys sp.]|nr:4Fe-4S ferredoxin [Pseudolabrys sp.]